MKVINLKQIQSIETEMLIETCRICEEHEIKYFLIGGSALGAIRHHGPIPWDSDVDMGIPFFELDRFCDIINQKISKKYYVDYCKLNKRNPSLHPEIFARGIDGRVLHIDIFPYIGLPDDSTNGVEHWKKAFIYNKMLNTRRFGYIGHRSDQSLHMKLSRVKHILECLFSYPKTEKSACIIQHFTELCLMYPYENAKFVTYPCGGNGTKNIIPKSWLGEGQYIEYCGVPLRVPSEYDLFLKKLYGDYMTPPTKMGNAYDVVARIDDKEFEEYWNGEIQ